MWIVKATPPMDKNGVSTFGKWGFRSDFFPRKIRYKKEAEALAEEARRKGGQNVKVDKA